MASSETIPARKLDVLGADFVEGRDEMTRLFQEQVRQDIAEHLAAGRPVYYGGTGVEAGKLFVQEPDGRHYEYRVLEDGSREIVREVQS